MTATLIALRAGRYAAPQRGSFVLGALVTVTLEFTDDSGQPALVGGPALLLVPPLTAPEPDPISVPLTPLGTGRYSAALVPAALGAWTLQASSATPAASLQMGFDVIGAGTTPATPPAALPGTVLLDPISGALTELMVTTALGYTPASAAALAAAMAALAAVASSGAYADLTGTPALAPVATSGAYADLTGKPTLAAVAFSGAYADLSGKPVLGTLAGQSSITHDQISDWMSATAGFLTTAPVQSVAGRTGAVTLTHADLTDWASATSGFALTAAIPTNNDQLTNGSGYLTLATAAYDPAIAVEGTLTNGEVFVRFVSPRAWRLPSGASGAALAGTAATGAVTIAIAKNGTQIGNISFGVGATTGTVSITSNTTFATGDVLTLTGPATADATLADLAISFAGYRS